MKILVAEDDPNTRAALVEILRAEGYSVIQAADGHHAMSMLENHSIDIACLDVMMPGKSGYDLCRHIRTIAPTMPVLLVTAKSEEIDKVVGLELGADDYIVKPFGSKEIVARIRAVARRCFLSATETESALQLPGQVFRMNDLEVNPKQLRARRGEQTIEISAREMKLLQLLFLRSGDVVRRSEMFRVGWDDHHLPNSRTLDQTVSQLRKRIEVDPKHPQIIQTVYGVGYRYEPDADGEPIDPAVDAIGT